MRYYLREAQGKDIDFIIMVIEKTFKDLIIKNGEEWDNTKQFIQWENKLNSEKHYIIEYNGTDIGIFTYSENQELIYLEGIFILPEFQGNGIGTSIISDLKLKKKKIELRTLSSNTQAQDFYLKNGFKKTREENGRKYFEY